MPGSRTVPLLSELSEGCFVVVKEKCSLAQHAKDKNLESKEPTQD